MHTYGVVSQFTNREKQFTNREKQFNKYLLIYLLMAMYVYYEGSSHVKLLTASIASD